MRDVEMTYREIGERLGGVSRERARQIVQLGLKRHEERRDWQAQCAVTVHPDGIPVSERWEARRIAAVADEILHGRWMIRRRPRNA